MSYKLNLKYGNKTLTFDDNGGGVNSLTLKCEGKLMTDDVIISCEIKPNIISFKIDDKEYSAIEGQPWTEWVLNEEYNTDDFYIGDDDLIYKSNGAYVVSIEGDSTSGISSTEPIIVDNEYYTYTVEIEPEQEYYIYNGNYVVVNNAISINYGTDIYQEITFTSNNTTYTYMNFANGAGVANINYGVIDTSYTNVWHNSDGTTSGTWIKSAYTQITVTQYTKVSKEFYDMFYNIFRMYGGGSD